MLSFLLLCTFIVVNLFYQGQSRRVTSLAMESVELVAQWNDLGNLTYGLLTDRFTQFGTEPADEFVAWEEAYNSFEVNLERFMESPVLDQQPEIRQRLDGAYRVWRYARVRLNTANYYLQRIIDSGLGEIVFVNGMLHTMYQLRMDGQLEAQQILLLDDMINALENLDTAADEFDNLFGHIIEDMKQEGELYLKRMQLLIYAIFLAAAFVLSLSYYLHRSVQRQQELKAAAMVNRRNELYRQLLESSSTENLAAIEEQRETLAIPIDFKEPLVLILLQVDAFREFSHTYNLEEQHRLIIKMAGGLKDLLSSYHFTSDHFRFHDDSVLFFVNVDSETSFEQLSLRLGTWMPARLPEVSFTCSVTIGELTLEPEDLDQEFVSLLEYSHWRYILGPSAFIDATALKAQLQREERQFIYPQDKERQFLEACKSLDLQRARELIGEMIEYAVEFGPECTRRLVIRLSAAESSVIDQLVKSFGINRSAHITPRLLEIQNQESVGETRLMLESLIERIIDICREKRNNKHDQLIRKIEQLVEEHLTDYNLSADMIADAVNLSSAYINRGFKQQTSMSIASFINDERLKRADAMILEGSSTVSEAASAAGFASMGTFFRLYKKKYGQTPGERTSEIFS